MRLINIAPLKRLIQKFVRDFFADRPDFQAQFITSKKVTINAFSHSRNELKIYQMIEIIKLSDVMTALNESLWRIFQK